MTRPPATPRSPLVAVALVLAGVLAGACEPDENAAPRVLPQRTTVTTDGGPSERGTADAGPAGASCSNGVRDGDETDIDCGGATCPACALGRACVAGRDCVSLACADAKCTNDAGCSDGSREGFTPAPMFPNIAACAGGWSVPGLGTTTTPACGRVSGNDSANPTGKDCSVADLCQVGWHVCETPAAVATKSGGEGCVAAGLNGQNAFFAIRQAGSGAAACGPGTNDLFGCGDVGAPPDAETCAPLDRFSGDLCTSLPTTWACGADGGNELGNVTKTASEGGGVLCCRDGP
ncbi:MAG: hypothetical protein BGO98_17890 [Myxococcales bacterium 68-20]|nr:hypothetical protein [Myxococcales bacterium]OJY23813.1 MAG: hypothetical protein BGO98_17890 [Myxococcales bacterium 68-20]